VALDVLRLFNRPVALAVSSSIRFNLNDFHNYGAPISTEVEAGLRFFRNIIGQSAPYESSNLTMPVPQKSCQRAICPVDKISHQLLSACARLSGGGKMSLTELENLRQRTRGMNPISEQDLSKLHLICAEGYIRLACADDALTHLQSIQFDPSFNAWAQSRLEDISTHGT
jgi:hypothetical protein